MQSPGRRSLCSNTDNNGLLLTHCKHVPAQWAKYYIMARAQWASRWGSGEHPGHGNFVFPTLSHPIAGPAHSQVGGIIQGMCNRVWEFGRPSQYPASPEGEKNCGRGKRRRWWPVRRHWRSLSYCFSKCTMYMNLLWIVVDLDSDLGRQQWARLS